VQNGPRLHRAAILGLLAGLATGISVASAQSITDLQRLSIEELANIQISSVSKAPEPLSDAPAAIYVISHDDIIRSGRTTLPEILRLAPNLEVAQLNATTYAISARGFNIANNASMSNKLLVLIDGRTVYTPLFAGIYWDMQGVLPEDIERIEVISGPGATLWGANAVNGVINVITRNSAATQGGVLELGAGNLQRGASLQYGGKLSDDLTYRLHAEGFDFSPTRLSGGASANDGWSKPQGGFRLDWRPTGDAVMLQGDVFEASEAPAGTVGGRDIVGSWQHQLRDGSSLQLQAYYDRAERFSNNNTGGFAVDTYDIEMQHSFHLGSSNDIVWGVGDRSIDYQIQNTASLLFVPAGRTLNLANIFGQDTISLSDSVKLILGTKFENEPFAGVEPMPSARLSWKVTDNVLLWSAVSRAVRAPTPVDRDIREFLGTTDFLNGSAHFLPEVLTAYEVGTRIQATPRVSFSISTFYNVYDDLRTIEPAPGTFLPLSWGNKMGGLIYGVEVWGSYRIADWWQLTAGFNIQHEHLRFDPSSSGIGGLPFAADDPNHQASLRSSMNLGRGVTWDADVRYVGKLPNPAVPAYAELDMRLGWQLTDRLELSLSGFNLLHPQHVEFVEPGQSTEIPRSFFVQTRWKF
jgi:iron complex outermembrane receptor protein